MVHANFIDLLSRLGFSRDGTAWLVPHAHTASVYLARGDESLVLDRVTRIEAGDATALIWTGRKEQYGFEIEEVRAFRIVADGK